MMKLRSLIENPFRNYAVFDGRAGRTEFWLFILTFIVITQLAWLLGFGVMKMAGYDRDHDAAMPHHMMNQSEYDAGSGDSAAEVDQTGADQPGTSHDLSDMHDDDMLSFVIHQHGGDGYHLHGVVRDDHIYSSDRDEMDDDDDRGHRGRLGYHGDRHVYIRFHDTRAERTGEILWMISAVALLLPLLAVGSRRLHDSSHSGWWQLLALIPVAGWLVLFIFFLLPSEEDENRFGTPPAS